MVKLPFFNRNDEHSRIKRAINSAHPSLVIIYGRRRCGKSRLLQQLRTENIIYFLADESDQSLQRQSLAGCIDTTHPGFGASVYPSWETLFSALNLRIGSTGKKPITLILDEFPYLANEHPPLPSILQKIIDLDQLRMHLILCGSSQRMMQNMTLNHASPLYGRATEIIRIRPLKPGWIIDAFNLRGFEALERFALWGGVPRYWEMAVEYNDSVAAITSLVLQRNGVLHSEPRRLLLDNMRTDTLCHSLLAVIGAGVHRLSEIAARLDKPAMNLSRPLDLLIDMGLISKDIPFGEPEKNSKRTLYRITDPFLRFWYRYVYPNLSALEQDLDAHVLLQWKQTGRQHIGSVWEDCARDSVPMLPIGNVAWKQGRRWWGKTSGGGTIEIDVVAESLDGTAILLGEVKLGEIDPAATAGRLRSAAETLPFTKGKKIITACWGGKLTEGFPEKGFVTIDMVLDALR